MSDSSEEEFEVRELMAAARELSAGRRDVVSIPEGLERPPFYNLDFVYPGGRGRGGRMEVSRTDWEAWGRVTPTSNRRYLGKPVVLARKLARKLTGWYTDPVVDSAREYDIMAARAMEDAGSNIEDIRRRVERLEKAEKDLESED